MSGIATRRRVAREQFVQIWTQYQDMDKIVEKTGLNAAACKYRASAYRKKGIKLPLLPQMYGGRITEEEVARLNVLIAEAAKKYREAKG